MSDVIYLQNVRLSFPQLATPKTPEGGGTAKYSADFLLLSDDPQHAKFVALAQQLAAAKWGEKAALILPMIYQDRRLRCFGSGDEKINKKTIKPYDGYGGMLYISASKDRMPQMIDSTGAGIDPNNTLACQNEARKMYGGCYVNAVVKPWIQDNQFGRGVRGDLVAVQFLRDGDPFGEGVTDVSAQFGATAAPGAPAAPAWAAPGMPAPPFPSGAPAAPVWAAPATPTAPSWM